MTQKAKDNLLIVLLALLIGLVIYFELIRKPDTVLKPVYDSTWHQPTQVIPAPGSPQLQPIIIQQPITSGKGTALDTAAIGMAIRAAGLSIQNEVLQALVEFSQKKYYEHQFEDTNIRIRQHDSLQFNRIFYSLPEYQLKIPIGYTGTLEKPRNVVYGGIKSMLFLDPAIPSKIQLMPRISIKNKKDAILGVSFTTDFKVWGVDYNIPIRFRGIFRKARDAAGD